MPLRPLSYVEVERRLLAAGFSKRSQKGSHVKFVRELPGEVRTVIVPNHREIAIGTLRSILRQANLTVEAFDDL